MKNFNIAFIGGGNMATSLIGGLIADNFNPSAIWVSDPEQEKVDALKQRFSNNGNTINGNTNNNECIKTVDVVVLAVKPQMLHDVITGIKNSVQQTSPLIISIAAGVRETDISRWFGGAPAVVRCMPNTPALLQAGATALYANQQVTESQREQAESILRAVGLCLWVDGEASLDSVTAISGSGPAYFFLMIEALANAGEKLGLDAEVSQRLAIQTAFGASKMALESPETAARLRQMVTSKGGTTERAIQAFEQGGFRELIDTATQAAKDRSEELATLLGQE